MITIAPTTAWRVRDTPNVREIEETEGVKIVGKCLREPFFSRGLVTGRVEVPYLWQSMEIGPFILNKDDVEAV